MLNVCSYPLDCVWRVYLEGRPFWILFHMYCVYDYFWGNEWCIDAWPI